MTLVLRRTAGTMTIIGLSLILFAALVGGAAVPAGAEDGQEDDAFAAIAGEDDPEDSSTTVDDKDTTTTNDPRDTTTTHPKTNRAEFSGTCSVDDSGKAEYLLAVTVYGDAGSTGSVRLDGGATYEYVIGDGGATTLHLTGHVGTNAIWVTDADGNPVVRGHVTLEDCTPEPIEMVAIASAWCTDGDYRVEVVVTGEAGASGAIVVDGREIPFTLDASGTAGVTVEASDASSTVEVRSGDGVVVYGPTTFDIEPCGHETTTTQATTTEPTTTAPPPTTTEPKSPPVATSATVTGLCTVDEDATYSITVTVIGDPGATGIITVAGTTVGYVIYDQGSHERTVPAAAGTSLVVVTDDAAGEIHRSDTTLDECDDADVLGTAPDGTGGAAPSPNVAVLGAQTTDELPFTGIDDGPLASIGAVLLAAGAVLLLATRSRDENDDHLLTGWNLTG